MILRDRAFLQTLNDELPGGIKCEIVGLEYFRVEKWQQIRYGDLSGFLCQIFLINLDNLLLRAIPATIIITTGQFYRLKPLPVPHVGGRLVGQTTQDEKEQFVVVLLVGEIPGKVLLHGLHHRVLLSVDEALQHDPHGHVDVVLTDKLPQVHLGVRLGHPDHALNVPGGLKMLELSRLTPAL